MAHFFDALTRLFSLLLQVVDGVVGGLKPAVKKVARSAAGALRWFARAVLGPQVDRARTNLTLRLAPVGRFGWAAQRREPGKARRLFQLVGWRLHGGGPRGEEHVEAA